MSAAWDRQIHRRAGWGARYGFAVLVTALAALLRWALDPLLHDTSQYLLFYFSVMAAALVAGTGPGVLAILLSAATGMCYFALWGHVGATWTDDISRLVLFILFGALATVLATRLHEARDRAAKTADSLRQTSEQARLLAAALEAAPNAISLSKTDPQGAIVWVNPAFTTLTGYSAQEAIGHSHHILGSGRQDEAFYRELWQTIQRGDVWHGELVNRRKDGTLYHEEMGITPLRDPAGRITHFVAVKQDITARKRAQEALRANEERFRTAAEISHSMVFDVDLISGQPIFVGGLHELLGYEPDEVVPTLDWWRSRIHPEDLPAYDAGWEQAIAQAKAYHAEYRIRRKAGDYITVEDASAMICDADGRSVRTVGGIRDITARKRTEEALRESELFYRQTLESIPGMVFTTRPDGYCDYQSQQWVEYTGVPMSEHLGAGWNKLLHPEDRPRAYVAWRDAVEGRAPYDLEYRVRRHDGQYEWFKVIGRPIRDAEGRIVRWFGVAANINALKQAEEALRQSEQRVRRKLDALLAPGEDIGELELADIIDVPAVQALMEEGHKLIHIPMAIIDLKGRVLVGVGWQDICTEFHRKHPDTCQYCVESDTQLSADVAPGEFRLYRCKNSMWDVATPILVGGKHVGNLFTGQFFFEDEPVDRELFRAQARLYGFDEAKYLAALDAVPRLNRDVLRTGMAYFTKLADMLSQLSYSNIKLARFSEALADAKRSAERAKADAEEASRAKDHFLAVLSHELRNPLTPVLPALGALDLLVPPEGREYLEMARRNVELEARLIDDLLDVTRIARGKIELERQVVELCSVVHRAAEVCRPDIEARRVHFGIMVEHGPHPVDADPSRLQQVFWNLIRNAIKFTPHDGCVGVRCWREDGRAVVEISDSGVGIEPEALSRIFNAFEQEARSTTRQFGGLGLGLAISKALVEMHGGSIRARSDGRNKGAVFTVELPLSIGTPQAQTRPPQAPSAGSTVPTTQRKLRILLVEDHGDTARIMKRLLSVEGHDVQHAGDVATALDLAQRQPFDLLLSDLGLPDGSGLDLMRQVRARGSTLPGIALSGYGMAADVRQSREAGFAEHLIKPVNFQSLHSALLRVAVAIPSTGPDAYAG